MQRALNLHNILNGFRLWLSEIQNDQPKMLQYSVSRRKETRFAGNDGTGEEVTEPRGVTQERPILSLCWLLGVINRGVIVK